VTKATGAADSDLGPDLGPVQRTLFIPLAARAAETKRKRPAIRDPKAVEVMATVDIEASLTGAATGGFTTVTRTLIFDWWVRQFLAAHPDGTVVELGAGLNTRFDRVDNGRVHWIDLDLPDTIDLRRRFFADTDRNRMLAASVLDDDWHDAVAASPGPYFLVSEGVLVYLDADAVRTSLRAVARRFPDAVIAFDTYSTSMYRQQQKMVKSRGIAPWKSPCDDPASLEELGLRLTDSVPVSRPPAGLRRELPPRYRLLLTLADPVLKSAFRMNLYRPHSA
jgi:O-methyltransferase involved in polyketide biosynthesis